MSKSELLFSSLKPVPLSGFLISINGNAILPETKSKNPGAVLNAFFFPAHIQSSSKTSWLYLKSNPESDHVSPYSLLPPMQTVIFSHLDYSDNLLIGIPAFALAQSTTSLFITNTAARGMLMSKRKSVHVKRLPKPSKHFPFHLA